jgi:DNA modification methylase
MSVAIRQGDCREVLAGMEAESAHCCVTSPPYWGLRDYGVDGQLGLEPTPDEYVAKMVEVFREVRRVLRSDGTLWLNLGDSYASVGGHSGGVGATSQRQGRRNIVEQHKVKGYAGGSGIKTKDLVGIPWRVAFALQVDGWYLRQDIIWHKPNPMPESVTDRCTKAHEYIFLLSKSARYYYDADAVKEPDAGTDHARVVLDGQPSLEPSNGLRSKHNGIRTEGGRNGQGRNRRSVWTVTTKPYKEAHFATFPPQLIEPCILAGCPAGGTVLDPFGGSGTTGEVAAKHGRNAVLIELNPEYLALAQDRCGLFVGEVA